MAVINRDLQVTAGAKDKGEANGLCGGFRGSSTQRDEGLEEIGRNHHNNQETTTKREREMR
jgi:hypothetical protein